LAILRVKNIGIEIKNTKRIYMKSALFSLKFRAKTLQVLAILGVKNNEIKIKKTQRIYSKSALFSLKF
jgi:hypothetical protein